MYYALEILKRLRESSAKLTGVIIKIEKVGYAFLPGANFEEVQKNSSKCASITPDFIFMPVRGVVKQPAREIMAFIHRANSEDGLPGVLNYLSFMEKKAA